MARRSPGAELDLGARGIRSTRAAVIGCMTTSPAADAHHSYPFAVGPLPVRDVLVDA
ncbi:MAG: hypothetical protein ACLQU9_07295 [Acidimicrobiales bacterium]